jgi:hypothetical protein
MNLQTPVAIPAAVLTNNMANVIDSLKRLERIGSEESETVRKILEAACDISKSIVASFPESLYEKKFTGDVEAKDASRVPEELRALARYEFGCYVVDQYGVTRNGKRVWQDRDTALAFAKDISMGLLDCLNEFAAKEHALSIEGLNMISEPADSLKLKNNRDD